MFKKIGMSLATGSFIFALLQPQQAQATATTDLGMKLAEKVAGLLVGEAFSSIFGGSDPAATPQEVQNIVNSGFNKAALNEIQVEIGTVMTTINTYNYTLSFDFNDSIIGGIIEQTGKVQTQVGIHMNHDNFMTLIPTYMSASTVQLAFLSERRRYVQLDGENQIKVINDNADFTAQQKADKIAEVKAQLATRIQGENQTIAHIALQSITHLADFFYEDFYERGPASQGCIYKYPETPWVAPNYISPSNKDFSGNDRSTVTCRDYAPLLNDHVTANTPYKHITAFTPWKTTDIMPVHNNDFWAFSIKKWDSNPGPHDQDYHMLVVKGEDLARYIRNLNSITKYSSVLGDIEGQVLSWMDIIASHGDINQLASATMKATKLGVVPTTMINRYKAKHVSLASHYKEWYERKLSGWGLSDKTYPTRIEFDPKEYYPTDAPAWLADAMN